MIVLFTDFGLAGPYTGQVKAVLLQQAPDQPVLDLFADAPACNPKASAYLLAAYTAGFPPGTVFLCVVDPGVGGPRRPCAVQAGGHWFVGPDNGLFELVARRSADPIACWTLTMRPPRLSATFHGRDLFAPAAALIARGAPPPGVRSELGRLPQWPDDLAEVIYIDGYGNAMTGLRASAVRPGQSLRAGRHVLPSARTFSDVGRGKPFWYVNANGLVEIAVNGGRADQALDLAPGTAVSAGPMG
jgi:S-adenosylmethionine hydrolase